MLKQESYLFDWHLIVTFYVPLLLCFIRINVVIGDNCYMCRTQGSNYKMELNIRIEPIGRDKVVIKSFSGFKSCREDQTTRIKDTTANKIFQHFRKIPKEKTRPWAKAQGVLCKQAGGRPAQFLVSGSNFCCGCGF